MKLALSAASFFIYSIEIWKRREPVPIIIIDNAPIFYDELSELFRLGDNYGLLAILRWLSSAPQNIAESQSPRSIKELDCDRIRRENNCALPIRPQNRNALYDHESANGHIEATQKQ